MKRSRGEMHIKEMNIVPQGFESPQQENVNRWLHNQIDQTSP